ncbi:MAG: hypothetical protein ACI9Y1_003016, partial [Lentisphaeria bacterium]
TAMEHKIIGNINMPPAKTISSTVNSSSRFA